MSRLIDLTGQRFGELVVLERGESRKSRCGHPRTMWVCRCDCGEQTVVDSNSLKRGSTVTCGKHKSKNYILSRKTHGMSKTRIYKEWASIKNRCNNPNAIDYERYGGRGITVCKEWLDDFMNFYNWAMANGYRDDLTIDRINVDGNYEPSNCRWATNDVQVNNKRTNHFLQYNEKTQTIAQWSRETGIDKNTLISRVDRYGWSVKEALTTPPNGRIKIKKEKQKKERKKINRNAVSNRKCFYCENYDRKKGYCELHKQDKKNWNMCKSFNWKDGV